MHLFLRAAQMQAQGALEPPPGVTPNFVHPYSLEGYVLATQIIFFTLVPVCVLSRLYTSFFVIDRFGLEEYTCFVSWLLAIVYSVLLLEAGRHGSGVHQWDVRVEELVPFLKIIIAGELIYAITIYLVKVTILLLYLRIFGIDRKTRRTIQALLVVLFGYYAASIGAKAAVCIPLSKLWEPELDGHCIDSTVFLLTDCVASILSDFSILILPMPLIWALQMPVSRKIEVMTVFAMGSFACISSVMRIYYTALGVNDLDVTFNYAQVWLWSIPEVNCGLICGCLPILPAFFQDLRKKWLPSVQSMTPTKGRYFSSQIYSRRNPFAAGRSDESAFELDEAGLIGTTVSDSMNTSATNCLDGSRVAQAAQKDGILKQVHIEQKVSKRPRDGR